MSARSHTRPLQPVVVRHGNAATTGYLLLSNDRVIVLLNNLVSRSDLGPFRPVKRDFIDNEADAVIIPAKEILEIQYLPRHG